MIGWTLQTNRWFMLCHLYFYHLIARRSVIGYRTWHLNSLFRFINLTSKYQFYMHLKSNLGVSKSLEDSVGTLESETFRACFHVCVIAMQLFFSIWEFRSQQISSSTENVYLVKTSVIFAIRADHALHRAKDHERENHHIWGRAFHRANCEGRIMCILVALKGYGCYVLKANVWDDVEQ